MWICNFFFSCVIFFDLNLRLALNLPVFLSPIWAHWLWHETLAMVGSFRSFHLYYVFLLFVPCFRCLSMENWALQIWSIKRLWVIMGRGHLWNMGLGSICGNFMHWNLHGIIVLDHFSWLNLMESRPLFWSQIMAEANTISILKAQSQSTTSGISAAKVEQLTCFPKMLDGRGCLHHSAKMGISYDSMHKRHATGG